jgi:hypothetical protein
MFVQLEEKEYPQAVRSAWADAYAAHCGSVWRVIDAQARLAASTHGYK